MRWRGLGLGLLAMPAFGRGARGGAPAVRIVWHIGLLHLPLMVVQHEKRVEKHAGRLGLASLVTARATLGSPGAMIDGLLAG